MSTLIFMKVLEKLPNFYDRAMNFITFGTTSKIKRKIASSLVSPGSVVLDIGCGTGELAGELVKREVKVVGVDASEKMLASAKRIVPQAEFHRLSAVEIASLGKEQFDHIVSTFTLSELQEEEIDHVLMSAYELLKPEGTFILADEVIPRVLWKRLVYHLIRTPLIALTFLLTGTVIHPLRDLPGKFNKAGFEVVLMEYFFLDSIWLVVARKE